LREPTAVRRDGRVGGGAIIVEREHAAVVDDDGGVSGRARVVEVQIVVVGEAWRERGIVDDAGTVDVEGDSRAARYKVKNGRPSGELDRIDMLPFLSLMTPLSGSLAIRPRLAFAKSALSDHGSEAVEFLLNSGVDGDAGSPAVEAVCAATLRGAANNLTAAVAAVKQTRSRRFRFKLDITSSVSRIAAVLWRGCKIERTMLLS